MGHFDKEFSLKSMLEIQPTFYIDEKSGMIIPEEFMINPMDSILMKHMSILQKEILIMQ